MRLQPITIASSIGAIGFGGSYRVLTKLGFDSEPMLVALVAGVAAFCIVISGYYWVVVIQDWLKDLQRQQRRPTVQEELIGLLAEGQRLDTECHDGVYREYTEKMREWRARVLNCLAVNGFSKSAVFSFEHVEASELDSYQWGHKLRMRSLRGIVSDYTKDEE